MRKSHQALASNTSVKDLSEGTSGAIRHDGGILLPVQTTREERRLLLEASVAVATGDYDFDQDWVGASLHGSTH